MVLPEEPGDQFYLLTLSSTTAVLLLTYTDHPSLIMINFLAMALYSSMKISMYFFHVTLCQLSMSTLLWNYTTTDLWSCYWTCSFIIKCHYIITTTCRFSISTKSQLARSCLYFKLRLTLCASFFALSLLRQLEIHIGPTFLTPPSRPTYSTHPWLEQT